MKKRKLNKLVGSWRPWDYGFNLEVEREMFRKQAQYFAKSEIAIGDKERGKKCELLVKLLDIILGDDSKLELIKAPNYNFDIPIEWEINAYINTRNANRFFSKYHIKLDKFTEPVFINELREAKAWYLYHELRKNIMQTLWN